MIHNDAWLAGIYEGEGNLYHRPEGGWMITISMTDRDVVERVAVVAGCGNINIRKHSRYGDGWSDQWAWRVGARPQVADLLYRIRPFLGERRGAAADVFLKWHASGEPAVVDPAVRARSAERLRTWRAGQRLPRNDRGDAVPAEGDRVGDQR